MSIARLIYITTVLARLEETHEYQMTVPMTALLFVYSYNACEKLIVIALLYRFQASLVQGCLFLAAGSKLADCMG